MVASMRHRLLPVVHILAALSIASPARAQSAAEDRAAADALYEEAGNLMKAGRFTEACPKLEASQKLDPGIGTTMRLGYCYEHAGRTASAWSAYNDAEGMARKAGDKRADDAAKRAKQLEPLLSRMVLDVAPENRAGGVEIRRDGRVIDPAAWTSAIPIDPGTHVIDASGAARLPWKTTITVEAKPGTQTVAVPALAAAPVVQDRGAEARPFWSGQRIAGVAVGGAGFVGLVVGAVFGIKTLGKTSDAKAHCAATMPYCDATGLQLQRDAASMAKGADAALILGGAAVVGGVVLFLTAPSATPKAAGSVRLRPVVGFDRAGISLETEW
jgi:serine/threonine-protein kinase